MALEAKNGRRSLAEFGSQVAVRAAHYQNKKTESPIPGIGDSALG